MTSIIKNNIFQENASLPPHVSYLSNSKHGFIERIEHEQVVTYFNNTW